MGYGIGVVGRADGMEDQARGFVLSRAGINCWQLALECFGKVLSLRACRLNYYVNTSRLSLLIYVERLLRLLVPKLPLYH